MNSPLSVAGGDGRFTGGVGLLRLLQEDVVEDSENWKLFIKQKNFIK